jgi:hypothetical protein
VVDLPLGEAVDWWVVLDAVITKVGGSCDPEVTKTFLRRSLARAPD